MVEQTKYSEGNTNTNCIINDIQESLTNCTKIQVILNYMFNKQQIQETPDATETNADNIHVELLNNTFTGDYRKIKELLEKNAMVNVRDENCLTPLHISIFKGRKDIFDLLVSKNAKLDAISRRDICPIYTACEYGRVDMLREILIRAKDQIWQRDGYESLPIHVAAYKGHLDCLEELLKGDGDRGINAKNLFGLTPLHCATLNNKDNATLLLLWNGADPNVEQNFGFRPLHYTGGTGSDDAGGALIAHGADIDPLSLNKCTPLYLSSCTGNKKMVEFLLSNNAQINIKGPGGNTPLHGACSNLQTHVAEILLNNHADINSENDRKEIPLHMAISSKCIQTAGLLISTKGCNINAIGPNGNTPLHYAIELGCSEIIEQLFAKGANINIPNLKGVTPCDLLAQDSKLLYNLNLSKLYTDLTVPLTPILNQNQNLKIEPLLLPRFNSSFTSGNQRMRMYCSRPS